MKLCVDCKHCVASMVYRHAVCTRLRVAKVSSVTGNTVSDGPLLRCDDERSSRGFFLYDLLHERCGPDGKYFDEKD